MPFDLSPYRGLFNDRTADHTGIRTQENTATTITLLKGNLVANSRQVVSGCSARSYRSGFWGFASAPRIDREALRSVVRLAGENANFLSTRGKRRSAQLHSTPFIHERSFATTKTRLSQNAIVGFLQEIDAYIQTTYPELAARQVSLRCLDMEKTVETSFGSRFHSLTPRSHVIVALTTEKDGKPVEIMDAVGGLGQFEDVFRSPVQLHAAIDELYQHLMKKRDGVYAQAGEHDVVLAPNLAGILAHEAIGHTVEADLVMGGSVAGDYMNQVVASPLVSLVDFAHTALGKTCPVPVYSDDEGTEAKDCVIIENGILKSFMHNKESADFYGTQPTGNARAWEFSDEPLIRMRNTAILPGQSKLADMIASIENGYYLMTPGNGQADSTSEYMFSVKMGYEVKNGKLGRAIRETTISGIAFDMLKTVSMVSDDMAWESAGFCGKKQPIPVGMGGPAIKCRATLGGQ